MLNLLQPGNSFVFQTMAKKNKTTTVESQYMMHFHDVMKCAAQNKLRSSLPVFVNPLSLLGKLL